MEGLREKFVVNLADRTVMVGKIDGGQKKMLHFSPNEALVLLGLLKKEENALIRMARQDTLPNDNESHLEPAD